MAEARLTASWNRLSPHHERVHSRCKSDRLPSSTVLLLLRLLLLNPLRHCQQNGRDSATLATRVTSTRHCNSFTRSQTFVPASWATVGIGGDISKSLTAVAKVLQETASLAVSPREVKQAVDAVTDRFSGYEQRDAHEFLSDLIDRVHDELEETEKGDEKENKEPNEAAVAEKNEKTAPPPTDEFSE